MHVFNIECLWKYQINVEMVVVLIQILAAEFLVIFQY